MVYIKLSLKGNWLLVVGGLHPADEALLEEEALPQTESKRFNPKLNLLGHVHVQYSEEGCGV